MKKQPSVKRLDGHPEALHNRIMDGISLAQELKDALYSLALFAVIVPIEMFLNKESRDSLKNRFVNLLYMAGYLFLGGFMFQLLLPYVEVSISPAKITNPFFYVLAYLLITDLIFYIYHRLQHRYTLLWRVHRPHHSDPDMNITTSLRTHPLEYPIQYLVISYPVAWILGYNESGMLYGFYVAQFFLYLAHTKLNVNFGFLSNIIVTPTSHRIHHSSEKIHRNKNFAQYFSFIDILGGTYHPPQKDEFPKTGL